MLTFTEFRRASTTPLYTDLERTTLFRPGNVLRVAIRKLGWTAEGWREIGVETTTLLVGHVNNRGGWLEHPPRLMPEFVKRIEIARIEDATMEELRAVINA